MLEVVDSRGLEGQASLLDNMAGNKRNRHAARWAFLLFLGGFLAVWGYGYLTRAYDIPLLSLVTQNEAVKVGVQAVSANLLPAGLASGVVLLAALLILHRRKG